jgi:hypothetical protein
VTILLSEHPYRINADIQAEILDMAHGTTDVYGRTKTMNHSRDEGDKCNQPARHLLQGCDVGSACQPETVDDKPSNEYVLVCELY